MDEITEDYNRKRATDDALEVVKRLIDRAKDVYINDSTGIFHRNQTWFKTRCRNRAGSDLECIVLPPLQRGDQAGLLIDYTLDGGYKHSHSIATESGTINARLKVMIKEADGELIDPLDFRYSYNNSKSVCIWIP